MGHPDREASLPENVLALVAGSGFAISDNAGDIQPGSTQGFYFTDTRFLSEYRLLIEDERPFLLNSANLTFNSGSVYSTNPSSVYGLRLGELSVVRDRIVGEGLHDDLLLVNYGDKPMDLDVSFHFNADFADIFEVRGAHPDPGGEVSVIEQPRGSLRFTYRKGRFQRASVISFSRSPRLWAGRARFRVSLDPREQWRLCINVQPVIGRHRPLPKAPCPFASFGPAVGPLTEPEVAKQAELGETGGPNERVAPWSEMFPELVTDEPQWTLVYDRAVKDLAALGMHTEYGTWVPAAGLPWFMALFGRDTLITSYQALAFNGGIAREVLKTLALYQGSGRDTFREEEPGKIPHEVRAGVLVSLGRIPHGRYYGSVDATPLWLILLGETYRWWGDRALVDQLWPNVLRALNWIDEFGDLDGDGFVEYRRRSSRGLVNQSWKDSVDSMRFADGRTPHAPIATCEVQGYVYAAWLRAAELFELRGEPQQAASLRQRAARLQQQFHEAFWMPQEGFVALALDGRKRQVDSITSNPGQCLWTGILYEANANQVAERLLADDLFSGWGIRTMSSLMRAYNPLSYHNGAVWPHDNSLAIAGLAAYGHHQAAVKLAEAQFAAAMRMPHYRLPELFAGYRRRHGFPVDYPGANAPQAWAAGAVILMLTSMLGLRPRAEGLLPLPGTPAARLSPRDVQVK